MVCWWRFCLFFFRFPVFFSFLAAFPSPVVPLVPFPGALSSGLALRRLRPVVALGCCVGVALLRQVLSCCSVLRWCAVVPLVWCSAPFWGAVWCCSPPPPLRVLCAFFFGGGGCVLVVLPPAPPRLAVVPCAVRLRASCRLVLLSVVCCVFCMVLCGVVVLGWVLAPCCPARCCARSCCTVFVVLCFRVLLCSLRGFSFFLRCSLPFRGAPGCFCLCGAPPWCVLLFTVALSRCVPVSASFALCRLVVCRAVVCLLVLCCVVGFGCGACVASCLVRCCRFVVLFLSLGVVLCRPAVLPVVRLLLFLMPCFWARPFSWSLLCGAPLVCLCRCSLCDALSPLWRWLVLCVVACCVWVFAVGPGCPLLPPGGSWCRASVVLSLSGRVARRPVVWCSVTWC